MEYAGSVDVGLMLGCSEVTGNNSRTRSGYLGRMIVFSIRRTTCLLKQLP